GARVQSRRPADGRATLQLLRAGSERRVDGHDAPALAAERPVRERPQPREQSLIRIAMKPILLALVEGAAVFSGVTAMTALWRPDGVSDVHLAAETLLQALVLSICCIVAFYYNDL